MRDTITQEDVDCESGVSDWHEYDSDLKADLEQKGGDWPPLIFRRLGPQDRQIIQDLHDEWFPVKYEETFYDELVHNRMVGSGHPLFTRCIAVDDPDEGGLAACVVGAFGSAIRLSPEVQYLLISNPIRYTNVFYLMTLGTVKRFRKLGLARTMVERCISMVENDPSCGVIYLHVITFNTAAIKLYESLGFYRIQEIQDYYVIDDVHYNCFLYAKYFHGNHGHNHIYKIMSRAFSVVWRHLRKPLSLLIDFEEVPVVTSLSRSDPTVAV